MDILELLLFAKKENASDLHISSGEPPMIRIHADMRKIDVPLLSKEDVHKILYDVLGDQQRKTPQGTPRAGLCDCIAESKTLSSKSRLHYSKKPYQKEHRKA